MNQKQVCITEHWKYSQQKQFTKEERAHTTVLFGGLTFKHERLVKAVLKSLGYKPEILPNPTAVDFHTGKEYGNYGQCNPTYFIAGSLINYLKYLQLQGLSKQEIIDKYVFVTASSHCGPCRFGMYQNEYRLATANAGFGGFRILTFDQTKGINQSSAGSGLEINADFFVDLIQAFSIGDLLNEVVHAIRPYEVNPGETDKILEESLQHLEQVLESIKPRITGPLSKVYGGKTILAVTKFYSNVFGKDLNTIIKALKHVGKLFGNIEIDRTKVKPIVKIIGEFWAQTTEGDGNFNMFSFLEHEGTAVLVEPIATWISYIIHQEKQDNQDRKGLVEDDLNPGIGKKTKSLLNYYTLKATLLIIEKLFNHAYHTMGRALLSMPHELVDQKEIARLGHPYYNTRVAGGEGHLEVGKNIYYHEKGLCHMVLSLKPFGCMPSTQSDGAQAAVQSAYGNMTFLPIETSGEGEVNAHSRVQMTLGEAKQKAKKEYELALQDTGLAKDQVQGFIETHPELKRPDYKVPQHKRTVGVAANTIYHIKSLMS